ncbi:MAG: DNA polymerase II large subunit, partial [archaeon]
FLNLQKKIKSESNNSLNINTLEKFNKILPNYNILKDVIAGRPVFSFPMKKGGFRLRYGRNRVSGFASSSISSATYEILDNFIGVGTQLRIERPGKSTIITPCDTIEGPIVKLKNDDVVKLNKKDDAIKLKSEIKEILHLGDILLNYGDFYENNHILVPNGYCEEEWVLELLNNINN